MEGLIFGIFTVLYQRGDPPVSAKLWRTLKVTRFLCLTPLVNVCRKGRVPWTKFLFQMIWITLLSLSQQVLFLCERCINFLQRAKKVVSDSLGVVDFALFTKSANQSGLFTSSYTEWCSTTRNKTRSIAVRHIREWRYRIKYVDDTSVFKSIPRCSPSYLPFIAANINTYASMRNMRLNEKKVNIRLSIFWSINPLL